MILTIKFDPGQEVWWKNGKIPQKTSIQDVMVRVGKGSSLYISYAISGSLTRINESKLFPTKEALLASL